MKYVCCVVVIIFAFVCCQKKVKKSCEIIVVPVKETPEAISADSIFKSVEYIPLETSEESLIVNVNKCVWYDGNFYLMDKEQKAILAFNEKGKFQGKLERQGRAPGEYISLNDFFIQDSALYVLSRINKKILVYDLSFEYVKDIKLDEYATNMVWADDKIYIFNNYAADDLMNFRIIDLHTGKILSKCSPFPKKQKGTSYQNATFSVFNNKVYAFLPNSYFVYELGVDLWKDVYYVDFGEGHRLPEGFEDYTGEERKTFKRRFEASPWKLPILGIDDFCLGEQLLHFSFTNGFFYQHFFEWRKYDKKYVGHIVGSRQFPFANNQIVDMSDEYCITIGNTLNIFHQKERGLQIPSALNDVRIDDNPFLCIFSWNIPKL